MTEPESSVQSLSAGAFSSAEAYVLRKGFQFHCAKTEKETVSAEEQIFSNLPNKRAAQARLVAEF